MLHSVIISQTCHRVFWTPYLFNGHCFHLPFTTYMQRILRFKHLVALFFKGRPIFEALFSKSWIMVLCERTPITSKFSWKIIANVEFIFKVFSWK